MKELMLLKVIAIKNVLFVVAGFLIMGLNFKILCVMVAMIWRWCVLMWTILLLSFLKMLLFHIFGISKSEAIHLVKN